MNIEMRFADENESISALTKSTTVDIINHAERVIFTGSTYRVEMKMSNNFWQAIPFREGVGFEGVLFSINPSETMSFDTFFSLLDMGEWLLNLPLYGIEMLNSL